MGMRGRSGSCGWLFRVLELAVRICASVDGDDAFDATQDHPRRDQCYRGGRVSGPDPTLIVVRQAGHPLHQRQERKCGTRLTEEHLVGEETTVPPG